jgi:hypothetical protein
MENISNTNQYDKFAYHTALLNDFVLDDRYRSNNDNSGKARSVHGVGRRGGGINQMTGSNTSSIKSTSSIRHLRRGSTQGGNVFNSFSKKNKMKRSHSVGTL